MKIVNNILGNKNYKLKRSSLLIDDELKMQVERLKDGAKSVIMECEKWKNKPSAIFNHGYAYEKVQKQVDALKRGVSLLDEQRY